MAADVVFSSTSIDDAARSAALGEASADELSALPAVPQLSPWDPADFLLHPAEIAKGRVAAERYLSSFRSEESRRTAEEALETLATVISGGRCDSVAFPWQQVRAYHGAAALTILKEKGAPGRIEALRCRRDSTRSYRVVPDAYPARQVQKIRATLGKVLDECCELGFMGSDDLEANRTAGRSVARKTNGKAARGRLLASGELRALTATSAAQSGAEGMRDAVLFALVHAGLKIAEITALGLDSVRFSNKTGRCHIVARPRNGGRGRRVELTNDELIYLEDWLEHRAGETGPLLCTLGRGGRIEGKRLTTAMLKQICEGRAVEAEVAPFTTGDLSRSAEALTEHRRAARRRATREAQAMSSTLERLLFEDTPEETDGEVHPETIRFPFLGLSL